MSRESERCIPVVKNGWLDCDQETCGLIGVPDDSCSGEIREVISVCIHHWLITTKIKRVRIPIPENINYDYLCNPQKNEIIGFLLPQELQMILRNGVGIEVNKKAFRNA